MTAPTGSRSLSHDGVVRGGRQVRPGHRNLGGQDKSDGPAGVYAVVVLSLFWDFAIGLGAIPARKPRLCLVFGGTIPGDLWR